jgi:hypothetical protein
MSRKNPLDARKKTLNNLKKQAVEFPLEELLPEEQRKKLQPEKPEKSAPNVSGLGEELPQPEKLPGGPSHTVRPNIPGQSGESPDVPGYTKHRPNEYTGMSPEELEKKREELGVGKEQPEEKSELPKRPTWRDVVKDKLKSFDPKEKTKERMEALYGPGEQIEAAVEGLENFSTDMANVDINSARSYIESSNLPDALKERAEKLLRGVRYDPGNPRANKNGEVPVSGTRVLQHALNQLGVRTKPQTDKATAWLENDPKGQEFMQKARDQYLIRTTMNMMKNIILHQEGEKVIQIGPSAPRTSPEQRKENKRLKELQKLLDKGEISVEEYNSRVKQEEKAPTPKEPARESAVPGNVAALNELQRKFNNKEISEEEYRKERARLLAARLSLRKLADVTGPGGEDWFSGYESGPQVNRDKYRKKNRFPFDGEPSSDIRVNKGPAKHDLPVPDGAGPAGDDNWGLLAIRDQMRKTADNDMFECYSYGELAKGPWFSYTLFKRAYENFKPGDIVVQFGKIPQEARTYRRRFGSVKNANKHIEAALLPAISTIITADTKVLPKSVRLPGRPTPNESLHELPDSKDNPVGGVYGPRTPEYDKEPWQGNRDGFDRPKPRREQDVQRNVFPYEDQEISNQVQIFGGLNLRKKAGLFITPLGKQQWDKMHSEFEEQPKVESNKDYLPIEEQLTNAMEEGALNFPEEYDTWLDTIFNSVNDSPGITIQETVAEVAGDPDAQEYEEGEEDEGRESFQDQINDVTETIQLALKNGWLENREFDLPSNLPEGMASRLNLRKAQLLDQFGNPIVNPNDAPKVDENPKEYVTDVAPGPMGEWPIYQQPTKGWGRFWEWLGNAAEAFPTKISKLNLRKTAGWYLTPKGEELAESIKNRDLDVSILNLNEEDSAALSLFINMIRIAPGTTLEYAIEAVERTRPYKTFEGNEERLEEELEEKEELNVSKMARDGAQLATTFGLVELKEPELNNLQNEFDLPENMPDSKPPAEWDWQMFHPASKLNLRKSAVDLTLSPGTGISTSELYNLYNQINKGIYDSKEIQEVFYGILTGAESILNQLKPQEHTQLFTSLYTNIVKNFQQAAKGTPEQQFAAIDRVVHLFHEGNTVIEHLLTDAPDIDDTTMSDEQIEEQLLRTGEIEDFVESLPGHTHTDEEEDRKYTPYTSYSSRLNLRKIAGLHITPSGEQKLQQLNNQLENVDLENLDPDLSIESQLSAVFPNEYDAWLLSALDGISLNPGFKVYQIVNKLQEGGLPQDAIDELVKAIHYALISDWVEEREFDLPQNLPNGMASKLNLKKTADVGNFAAPVVETPEDRAATIEQDIPNAINLDPKRPFPPKRKRHDFNETQLYNENEHADNPLTHYTNRLNLKKTAFDFNVSIFHPQTNQFVEETVLSAPSMEQAQLQAQEFVNKSFPGYSFQVTDPYNETPKTLGINSVSESRFMDNSLNLRKQADENFPTLRNELFHLFQEYWPNEITPETVNQASEAAITAFKARYPQIEQRMLEELARATDFLLSHDGKASNLVNAVKGISLF